MSNVTLNIKKLQLDYPKTWKDFLDFKLSIDNSSVISVETFQSLAFEYQLGLFLHYFADSGIDIDLNNYTFEILPNLIEDAFRLQENNISHYS